MANIANNGVANQVAFGQYGSAFKKTAAAVTPPSGMVIVAVTFLEDNTPTALIAETPEVTFNTASAAHSEGTANESEGTGGATLASQVFPKGLTIYGRWTSITPSASGVIIYFGP